MLLTRWNLCSSRSAVKNRETIRMGVHDGKISYEDVVLQDELDLCTLCVVCSALSLSIYTPYSIVARALL